MVTGKSVNMAVDFAGIRLKNPVLVASGTFGFGKEFAEVYDLSLLGGIVTKGTSLEPRRGNAPPRIFETAAGMLNAIGLQNDGVDSFVKDKLPFLNTFDTHIIVNIVGNRPEEYAALASTLNDEPGVSALEVNISCPNVEHGQAEFGSDPIMTFRVVNAVRKATNKPVIPKLSPNVADIKVLAKAAQDGGADGISLINTLVGTAIDARRRRFRLANVTGGLSGPCIKPIALRMVWEAAKAVSIPIMGIGGIVNAEDAVEFLLAGATAIQVGTANFVRTLAPLEIIDGLRQYLTENGFSSPEELRGRVEGADVE